jgi:flagellar basal body-associated protein FliL
MESTFIIIAIVLVLAIMAVGAYIAYQHFFSLEENGLEQEDISNPEIVEVVVINPNKPPKLPE